MKGFVDLKCYYNCCGNRAIAERHKPNKRNRQLPAQRVGACIEHIHRIDESIRIWMRDLIIAHEQYFYDEEGCGCDYCSYEDGEGPIR